MLNQGFLEPTVTALEASAEIQSASPGAGYVEAGEKREKRDRFVC